MLRTSTFLIKPVHFRLLACGLIVVGAIGCTTPSTTLPDPEKVSIPDKWSVSKLDTNNERRIRLTANKSWLSSFNDSALNGHVFTAIANNPDLSASAARLRASFNTAEAIGARLYPSVSANVDASRTENETGAVSTTIRSSSATLAISWEADLWGRLTQRKRSALLGAKASEQFYRSARLSLAANVARAWYNLLTFKLQLDLAQERLQSFKTTAELIDENYRAGSRSALDVFLSKSDVEFQVARKLEARTNFEEAERAFANLLGLFSSAQREAFFDQSTLPTLTSYVDPGLPAKLIERRPDIVARKLTYQASIASADAAFKDRFPSLRLTGSIGDTREKFDQLFEGDNLVSSLVGGITQPVFQAGALKAEQQRATNEAEASYSEYLNALLTSFTEVENSLERETNLQQRHEAVKQSLDYAQGGLELALERYQSGLINYNTVLEAQRRLFDTKSSEINLRNALLQNRIALHLALGGNF